MVSETGQLAYNRGRTALLVDLDANAAKDKGDLVMLTAAQYDDLVKNILELYGDYEDSVIVDIARRLGKAPMTSAAAWQAQRLSESGMLFEEILEKLVPLTGRSESELRNLFYRAGVRAMHFDDSIYKRAGLQPMPLNLSPAMMQILLDGIRKTNQTMRNLTLTTAQTGQDAYIAAADKAFMQVSSGAMSYQQAIRSAVKEVAARGVGVVTFPGRVDQLDVAMRRAVLTGVGQTTGNLQIARADEMDCDLVQTTAHAGARPSHQKFQGKIFSRSGSNKKYPDFVSSTGYGTGAGLMGWGCRHSFFPFFEGISENAYDQATLDEFDGRTVTYQKKEYSFYDATQQQRAIERKIRYFKRQASALEAAGLENENELLAVKAWQAEMRKFIRETGLVRQRTREGLIGV